MSMRAVSKPTLLVLMIALVASSPAAAGIHPDARREAAKTPEQVVKEAETAAVGAHSVHIVASGIAAGSDLSFDLALVAGKGGSGKMTSQGLSFSIIRIADKAYFKAGPAFWEKVGGSKAAAQLFAGKWIVASAVKGDLASFTSLTDLAALMRAILLGHGKLSDAGTATIRGVRTVALEDTGSGGGTLYVAASGKPYPVELRKASKGKISFKEWNRPVHLVAPANAISYEELTKKG
jgi:hypothetical protein